MAFERFSNLHNPSVIYLAVVLIRHKAVLVHPS